jgi:hypothetical protein
MLDKPECMCIGLLIIAVQALPRARLAQAVISRAEQVSPHHSMPRDILIHITKLHPI